MKGRLIDLTGESFGEWAVVKRSFPNNKKGNDAHWKCQCSCGTIRIINGASLRRGDTRSCGCLTQHGDSQPKNSSRTYLAWGNMKSRCLNANSPHYDKYGGRGIKICGRWTNSYKNFRQDMGTCPEGLTLERINNNKGYGPNNCKWGTRKEQSNNTRNNRLVAYSGKTQCVQAWADELNINYSTLSARLNYLRWPIGKALTHPIQKHALQGG